MNRYPPNHPLLPNAECISPRERNAFINREFYGEEFWLWMLKEYENLRAFRKSVSRRKPTEEELLLLEIYKPFEQSYARMLWGEPKGFK